MKTKKYSRHLLDYCKEPEKIENYEAAFAENFKGWDCHHRAEILPCGVFSVKTLKKFGLYYDRPPEELILLRHGEHSRLHHKGENNPFFGKHLSEETRKKMSDAKIGENHPFFGKHHSTESRKKMSKSHKGKQPWNKGKSLSEETRKKISEATKLQHERQRLHKAYKKYADSIRHLIENK